MAVKIRLTRTGKKNAPSYRIVAIDSRQGRDGQAIEIIGHYNQKSKPDKLIINRERLNYWISKGAQLSSKVKSFI